MQQSITFLKLHTLLVCLQIEASLAAGKVVLKYNLICVNISVVKKKICSDFHCSVCDFVYDSMININ